MRSRDGNDSCASGYCDGTLCCTSGDCCAVAADCPPSYSTAATCTDTSDTTDCQGTGIGPVCTANVCATEVTHDDRPCAGLEHACPNNFAAVACLDQEDQPAPVCATECTGIGDCAPGFVCEAPSCVQNGDQGSSCTGTGQGTCDAGLKCENNICCLESGPTCCATNQNCANGLACNDTVYSCWDSCNDYDSSRCADAVNDYCLSDACVPKIARGQSCTYDAECLDNSCVEQVCCQAACDQQCESCLESLTGQSDGTCAPILLGGTDVDPVAETCSGSTGCNGTDCVCDGNMACLRANNTACIAGNECAGGACECFDSQCTDMRCRESYCAVCEPALTVTSCGGDLGQPGPIEDPNPADACFDTEACFAGDCLKKAGESCSSNGECGNICYDGLCQLPGGLLDGCDSGENDDCAGTLECVTGACRKPDGESCGGDGECANGSCVDGVCCNVACTGPCADCATGTCLMPVDDDACGTVDCDGLDTECRDYADLTDYRCLSLGVCKPSNDAYYCWDYTYEPTTTACGSQPCQRCRLGTCSYTPVDDPACGIIDCDGSDSACRDYHDMSTNRCESFGVCRDSSDCVGWASYTDASSSTRCGACRICNGSGSCSDTPSDDPACGTIDCDPLDTACRDFHDLTSNRCEGFGNCKDPALSPTVPGDCGSSYTNDPPTADCGNCQVCSGTGTCNPTFCDSGDTCVSDRCQFVRRVYWNNDCDTSCNLSHTGAVCIDTGTDSGGTNGMMLQRSGIPAPYCVQLPGTCGAAQTTDPTMTCVWNCLCEYGP